jgi:hypothetical protein
MFAYLNLAIWFGPPPDRRTPTFSSRNGASILRALVLCVVVQKAAAFGCRSAEPDREQVVDQPPRFSP